MNAAININDIPETKASTIFRECLLKETAKNTSHIYQQSLYCTYSNNSASKEISFSKRVCTRGLRTGEH